MGNSSLVGTSMSNGTGSPYQLSGQNSVMSREWDGYIFIGVVPTIEPISNPSTPSPKPSLEETKSQITKNTESLALEARIQRENAANDADAFNDVKNKKDLKAQGLITDFVNNKNSYLEEIAIYKSYLYVPTWQDYARSSEKLAYDKLEADIAFASICKTDTTFPYGCNSHHSSIAQNYDLSVAPNVAGRDKYIRDNTRV